MINEIISFIRTTFRNNGTFFIVGGASRDFLLKREPHDYDIATSLTPTDLRSYLPQSDFTFANHGTVNHKYNNNRITFQTMRKEGEYIDYRHPSKIEFIDDYIVDSRRRDFTINSIYLGMDGIIYDPQEGIKDIRCHQIRMIGDPYIRLKEDPLRIIRAYRFKFLLNFEIDALLEQALIECVPLIARINPSKVKEEISKCPTESQKVILDYIKI